MFPFALENYHLILKYFIKSFPYSKYFLVKNFICTTFFKHMVYVTKQTETKLMQTTFLSSP